MKNVTLIPGDGIGPEISKAVMDILCTIVSELQGINSNTAATAKGISSIEIVSANEPISGGTKGSKSPKKSIDNRQANSNTGYDIARKMAAYN